ncbi:NADase-type glycan-binding domain-containing protein [Spirochaeta lutea]|uniref:NADase-type glycan-binding domain-containing protein n=1 Tax=Spirochaeta lutea TaxID=1480694 RepID=UPI000A84D25B|nr:hypothetical protein [Spirochaeta lutea]
MRIFSTLMLLLILSYSHIFSDQLKGVAITPSHYEWLFFTEEEIFKYGDNNPGLGSSTYSTPYFYEEMNKVPFIEFSFESVNRDDLPYLIKEPNQRWLVLTDNTGEFMYIYNDDFSTPLGSSRGFQDIFDTKMRIETGIIYSSSSSLTEGTTQYLASNLGDLELRRPWVEGVSGQGIGESVSIKGRRSNVAIQAFIVSNGFVSFENPSLYTRNSRLREIRIISENPFFDFTVELEDTPSLQIVNLPESTSEFEIIINDVYPGSQWQDTCVNFILPLVNF